MEDKQKELEVMNGVEEVNSKELFEDIEEIVTAGFTGCASCCN